MLGIHREPGKPVDFTRRLAGLNGGLNSDFPAGEKIQIYRQDGAVRGEAVTVA